MASGLRQPIPPSAHPTPHDPEPDSCPGPRDRVRGKPDACTRGKCGPEGHCDLPCPDAARVPPARGARHDPDLGQPAHDGRHAAGGDPRAGLPRLVRAGLGAARDLWLGPSPGHGGERREPLEARANRDGMLDLEYEVYYGPARAARLAGSARGGICRFEQPRVRRSFAVHHRARRGSMRGDVDLPPGWQAVTAWSPRAGRARSSTSRRPRSWSKTCACSRAARPVNSSPETFGSTFLRWDTGNQSSPGPRGPRTRRPWVRRADGARSASRLPGRPAAGRRARGRVVPPQLCVDDGGEADAGQQRGWGNLIAHEVFHLWNGWKLVGADYPTSQWFQEGFTEYAANVVDGHRQADRPGIPEEAFQSRRELSPAHDRLEAGGSHKGPPLYSAGALVAFSWDAQIRQATRQDQPLWTSPELLRGPAAASAPMLGRTCARRSSTRRRGTGGVLSGQHPGSPTAAARGHASAGRLAPHPGRRRRRTRRSDPDATPEAKARWQRLVTGA